MVAQRQCYIILQVSRVCRLLDHSVPTAHQPNLSAKTRLLDTANNACCLRRSRIIRQVLRFTACARVVEVESKRRRIQYFDRVASQAGGKTVRKNTELCSLETVRPSNISNENSISFYLW